MTPVIFRRAARLEYVVAVRWYERQRAGLGAEFAVEIRRTLMAASEFPERAPAVEADIRRIKAHRFPYYVFYRIRSSRLVVLAIFHARRRPIRWRKR